MDALALIAQSSTDANPATLIALLSGALGGPIFSIWFSYYMVTKYLPSIMERNAIETERLVENFRADIRHIVDQKYAGDKMLADALDGIRDTIREGHRELIGREKREIERDKRETERDKRRES